MASHECLVPDCKRPGRIAICLRLRTPTSGALVAPNTNAYLCDKHAEAGCDIDLIVSPRRTKRLDLYTRAAGGTTLYTNSVDLGDA